MMKSLATSVFASLVLVSSAYGAAEDEITMHMATIPVPGDAFAHIANLDTGSEPRTILPPEGEIDLGTIINIGQKVWDVIKANQPVLTSHFSFANAVPAGVTSGSQLQGFSEPQASAVRVWGQNYYGSTVYDFTLTSVHQYGGSYDGKGKFLETVSVIPTNVSVLWGYTVDVSVAQVTQVNYGTKSDPVAGLNLLASLSVSTVMKKTQKNFLYQFRGDSAKSKVLGLGN